MSRALGYCRALLAGLLLGSPALAQTIFDDNELRAGIVELAEQIVAEQQRVGSMSVQMDRLETELAALRTLILELEKTNGRIGGDNDEREQKLKEVAARLDAELGSSQRYGEDLLYRLNAVLAGLDAQQFRKAIDGYQTGAPPAETLKILEGIIAIGDLSSYASSATYWSGRLEYESGELLKAQEMLLGYLERYPADQHVPNAMLLLANIAAANEDPSQSKWEDLILELYPASPAAKVVSAQRSL